MRQTRTCIVFFSMLLLFGCKENVENKKAENLEKDYELVYKGWQFLGEDSTELGKMNKKENILLKFETNLSDASIICISKGSGVMAANESSIPKYDTLQIKSENVNVGFASADLGGFIRFRVFPTLDIAKRNEDKPSLDIEFRIDLKKNDVGTTAEPYDLELKKHVN